MKTLDEFKREHADLSRTAGSYGFLQPAFAVKTLNLLAELIATVEAQKPPTKEPRDEPSLDVQETLEVIRRAIDQLVEGEHERKVPRTIALLAEYEGEIRQYLRDHEAINADA